MNGLNRITDKILAEAKNEEAKILAEAEAKCAEIRTEYAQRAKKIREEMLADAEREGTDLVTRAKSASAMQKRNRVLQAKSELIDAAFSNALTALKNLPTEKYTELLAGLLAAAFKEQVETEENGRALYGEDEVLVPDSYEVLLNEKDRARCGDAVPDGAKKKLKGEVPADKLARLVLSDETAPIDGGLILRFGDIESNCSFLLLFAQLREELEAEVGRALFDSDKN